jgi:hypothetical protein
MWKTFLSVTAIVSMTVALQQAPADRAAAQDKKPTEKMTATEVESLVKQLGDNNFAIRDQASRRLEQTPGALAQLHPYLKHDVLEVRRRVAELVEKLSAKNFKSLLREIVERKQDVPLDLLIDLVVEHRERMDEDDWKGVLNAIACIKTNLLKGTKTKALLPDPIDGFPKFPVVRGESLLRLDRAPFKKKVVGSRIGYTGDFTSCVVITSGSFECGYSARSIVLANGGILMHHAPTGALVFGNEDIKCDTIAGSLIIARGRVNVEGRAEGTIIESLVFSDEDIDCEHLVASTVIAKGRVHVKRNTKSTVLENAANSAKVSYFSLKSVGLTLVPDGKTFRVDQVLAQSRANKCGFRVGDVLLIDAPSGLAELETIVRRSVAKETEPALPVRRNGEPTVVILRLWD